MVIKITATVTLKPQAYQFEVDKYGIEGLRVLWMDILERYGHEEYYEPDLVEELLNRRKEVNDGR